MARISPTPGQKIIYLLLILIGSVILYIDINTNTFQSSKNGYKSLKISTVFLLKRISIDPIKNIFNLSKSKKDLIKQNEILRKALDTSYLNNFLISRENSFYKDKNIIKLPEAKDEIEKIYSIAQLKEIDPNIFNCCDKHRMYIEIISNDSISKIESMVFNTSGIIGQVADVGQYLEVILLTDISHSIPIKSESENFFCNARGSGREDIIICSYNPLVWDEEIELGKTFYSSGLGGVFSRDIKIGKVFNIIESEPTRRDLEIKIIASPLESTLFGVIKY